MIKAKVNGWLKNVQPWLFPPVCLLCGAGGAGDVCAACEADLPWLRAACSVCAAPLPVAGVCGRCLRQPPPFDKAHALWRYAAPADALILRLKFAGKLSVARYLGACMAERLGARDAPLPQALIPVPLHATRLRERGFNQAVELARPLAAALGIVLDYRSCARVRATEAQAALPAAARKRNVRGAFAVARPLRYAHVAIVDDVMTSGHTVAALSTALRKAGVRRVEVWVCARTSPPA